MAIAVSEDGWEAESEEEGGGQERSVHGGREREEWLEGGLGQTIYTGERRDIVLGHTSETLHCHPGLCLTF